SERVCLGSFFFFQAEDGIRDRNVTGVQTCALPICRGPRRRGAAGRRHGVAAPRQGRRARRALQPVRAGAGRRDRRNRPHVPRRGCSLPLRSPSRKERPMTSRTPTLRSWSGAVRWRPQQVLRPSSQEAVVAAVQSARARGVPLRVLGGGHSFSAVAATEGITLTLDDHQGLVSADPVTGLVTLRGGTRLWAVAELLAPYGLALSVMGDIDRQSIAGAIQ